MIPRFVELVELQDGTWRAFADKEPIREPLEIKNIYKIDLDWRLLKNE